ncbi:MAG: MarR family transcriptional regulator [Actinomycetia bacterium]|nr:MarR family transcriptional regulator [Actinomycetes bacterium]MCP3911248.1 MarR family transcriptional regulator [Actinomycetes bacterium]MCP4085311.1 MarR family transcriptional regulator [Actinomycetes bacterium]
MAQPHPSPSRLSAWRAFLGAHAAVIETLDSELRSTHSLPLTWYDVLVQLSEADGRLRMSELANAVLLTGYNCTRLVDRMVTAGLVDRRPDPDDARVRWAVLTESGHNLLHCAAPTHMQGIQRLFAGIVEDDAEADRLTARFTAMGDAARQPPP